MGAVYLAFDRHAGHDVALKVLQGVGVEDRRRLKREFRVLSGIVHPNLVDLHDLVIDEHVCFFTMEYVRGVDLEERGKQLLEKHVDPGERYGRLRPLALQLALAVQALHEGGQLHRDIKPSNVLVTDSGRVVLLDFGLASSTSMASIPADSSNDVAGTVLYMAPEQLWGLGVSPASDWYSFGITLRQVFTGAPPTRADLLAKDKPTLREQGFSVPEEFDRLISQLLQSEPNKRLSGIEILECLGGSSGPQSRTTIIPPERIPSLVGREHLLAQLTEAFEQSSQSGRVLRLVGPSGIGKTSLMRRLFEQLGALPDTLLLSSRCHPKEALAFNALDGFVDELSRELTGELGFVRQELDSGQLQAIAQVFPVLGEALADDRSGPPLELSDREKRQLAIDAIRKLLNGIARVRRLVVWLDDVQWGDADSGRLLRSLLQAQDAPAMLLVLSYREGSESTSPCLSELREDKDLWQRAVPVRVDPLDEAQSADLMHSIAGESWRGAQEDRDQLLRTAAGSPFFLVEFAKYLKALQSLPGVSAIGLEELLRFRMQGLSPRARSVLEVLAVAAAPLERDTLLRAAKLESAQRGILADLEQLSIVRTIELAPHRIEFYHDKLREEVTRTLAHQTSVEHHRAIAHAVLSTTNANPLVALEHFEAAGELESVRRYVVPAANQALKLLAFERAALLYQRAIELMPGEVPLHELYRRLGSALGSAGRGKEAAAAFSSAADILRLEPGDTSEELMRLQQAAAEQFIQTGHFQQGVEMIREVLTALDVPFPRSRGQATRKALALRVVSMLRGTRPSERKTPPSALELRRFDALWAADTRLAMVDYALCNYATIRCVEDSLKLADPSRMSRALGMEAAFCSTLPVPVFQKRATALVQYAVDLANGPSATPYDVTLCKSVQAIIAFYTGRFRETWQLADEAIAELPPGRGWELAPWTMWSLLGLALNGELAELITRVRRLREEASLLDDRHMEMNISLGAPAIAWLALDKGRETLEQANKALSWAPSTYTVQHYQHYVTTVDCDLYLGNPLSAWQRTVETWPSHKREYFLSLTFVRGDLLRTRARAALGAAIELTQSGRTRAHSGETAPILLKEVQRAVAEMRRHGLDSATGFAELAQAGLENFSGRKAKALDHLGRASSTFDRARMVLYREVANYWIARLRGVGASDAGAWMSERGVVDPEQLALTFAPGFTDSASRA